MIKKIFFTFIVFLLATISIVGSFLFLKSINRVNESLEVKSVLNNSEFSVQGKNADRWLKSLYEVNKVPSISAAVGINGKLVWSGVIGYSDLEKKVQADNNTVYRVGSISKSITATTVMRMNEKGIIDIEKPLKDYVKDFSSNNGYTIKNLLSHQAGIRHYSNGPLGSYNADEYVTARDSASIVINDALLFPAGTGFNYSSYGYNLIALAIESTSSLPFEEAVLREVLSPIGMTATHLEKKSDPKATKSAVPHSLVGSILIKSPDVNLSDRYAGGGYLSTPSDLVRFGNALLGNEFLKSDSINKLWSPVPLQNGAKNPQNYALGFRVDHDEQGKYIHHGGISMGGYSFLLIYPDLGVVVVLASNISPLVAASAPFERLVEAKKLANIFVSQRN